MSELDDFRPRIRNWARAFRDKPRRGRSPLDIVLHELKVQHGITEGSDPVVERIDQQDAQFVDSCVVKLDQSRIAILRLGYLTRAQTFEEEADIRKAEYHRARSLGFKSAKEWRMVLQDAEEALMYKVHQREDLLQSDRS